MSGLPHLRGRGGFQYREFEACPESNIPEEDRVPSSARRDNSSQNDVPVVDVRNCSPWSWTPSSQSGTSPISDWYRLQSPDQNQLFLSATVDVPPPVADDDLHTASVRMPPPLPSWLWTVLVKILGINVGPTGPKRYCLATFLHILTMLSAMMFGMCGLFFNVYDTISEFTKTTVLVGIAKSVLGLYWIGLGIYANSLASRLFSNSRMVDCIRLHSKTFLKINTAAIVFILSLIAVCTNLYSTNYLLDSQPPVNGTQVRDANCASVGVSVLLCQMYYTSKVIYCCFCLTWNLLVVGIYLSVCRTHTICIRRFMKELLYDTKIYEEFCKLRVLEEQVQLKRQQSQHPQEQEQQQPQEQKQQPAMAVDEMRRCRSATDPFQSVSDSNIWDDDIAGFDHDGEGCKDRPSNAPLLQTLRLMRQNTRDRLTSEPGTSASNMEISAPTWRIGGDSESSYEGGVSAQNSYPGPHVAEPSSLPITLEEEEDDGNKEIKSQSSYVDAGSQILNRQNSLFLGNRPPIMSNDDLMFTYYGLVRRLSSTSRLLQRWISSWITFVLLWCALLIVYWTTHTAEISGIVQFLIPLVALGLLTSGYAEVNFEGERLLKCVLPTVERMPVIYYFQNSRMEAKIFSFTMTYNTIVTVVAGVAITFATRIILDQIA